MRANPTVVICLLTAVSCGKKENAVPAPAPTVTPTPMAVTPDLKPAGSDAAAVAAGGGSGSAAATTMPNKGGNCPSLVVGATTTLREDGGNLSLVIEAQAPEAVATIQKRTELLLQVAGNPHAGGDAHDHKGNQGGTAGICPVLVVGMDAKSTATPKGVTIAYSPKPNVRLDLAGVTAGIKDRIAKANAFLAGRAPAVEGLGRGGGTGGGKGEDGSNHSGQGDGKGKTRDAAAGQGSGSSTSSGSGAGSGGGKGDGTGGGKGDGTGGGGGAGTGGGNGGGKGTGGGNAGRMAR